MISPWKRDGNPPKSFVPLSKLRSIGAWREGVQICFEADCEGSKAIRKFLSRQLWLFPEKRSWSTETDFQWSDWINFFLAWRKCIATFQNCRGQFIIAWIINWDNSLGWGWKVFSYGQLNVLFSRSLSQLFIREKWIAQVNFKIFQWASLVAYFVKYLG